MAQRLDGVQRRQLAPQAADQQVNRPAVQVGITPAQAVEDLVAIEDTLRLTRQQQQQFELGAGQRHGLARAQHFAAFGVDAQAVEGQQRWQGGGGQGLAGPQPAQVPLGMLRAVDPDALPSTPQPLQALPLQPLQLVHADSRLLVANKPAGLLCVPGRGPALADCLATRVQTQWSDARVVHRLDMATSGLVLFARGALMQRRLSMLFEQRRMHKRYEAVVHGLLSEDRGEIDLPLAADWPNRPRQQVSATLGKASLTRWQVLSRDTADGSSRLALEPVTGRTHQLRVHLAAIGHPILGDALYAPTPWDKAAPRLLLHACSLAWEDALTGACRFDSTPPF